MIGPFQGESFWLSNFYERMFWFNGVRYPSVEHYYQAMKAASIADLEWVNAAPTPGEAKKRGRRVGMRAGFEEDKRLVMLHGLLSKFTQHLDLRHLLALTGSEPLVEVNAWGDRYWGMTARPDGSLDGQNHLGRLLTMTREVLR